jgi:hypothetical protein
MQTPPEPPSENPLSNNQPAPRNASLLQKWPILVEVCVLAAILVAIGGWAIPKLAARFVTSPPITKISITGTPYDCGDSVATSSTPLGAAAIQPHLSGVPAFTEDDVRDYINTHPFSGLRIETKGATSIKRILFITSYDACQLMKGESIGLSKNAIVCYVELSGTFLVSSPFPSATPQPAHHTGQEVFDGKTGNLLVLGVQ